MKQDSMTRHRERSRPQSRGSTASATTQPGLDLGYTNPAQENYSAQWVNNDHRQPKPIAPAPRITPDGMMLQAASQMQTMREFSMTPSVNGPISHSMSYHQQSMSSHGQASDALLNASFTEDSQMVDRDDQEDGDSLAAAASGLAPKSSSARTSANNELEMRHLFSANKHRHLQEVAKELHGNERGPNSERTRQVFAMLWINSTCTKGKGSVPRGRVYANYASRCATERVTVLNPASFGKLVRVLFPGLKTRRLGVRGESKYHYVNFSLVDDQPELREPEAPVPLVPVAPPQSRSASVAPTRPVGVSVPVATGSQPPADRTERASTAPPRTGHARSHSFYSVPVLNTADHIHSSSTKTSIELSFTSEEEEAMFIQPDALLLPRIEPFLPSNADPDAAKSLSALYRSHCTSLVECVRYCKEKTFFHLYTSFQGTLTMPVQKLLGHPSIAPWIEECDFILYQRMMQIVSGLTLQVVPKPVLDTLRNISMRLVPHVRESFQGQPLHVIHAKEAPATVFAALLDRALRVNLTAHAAANMLSNPANRDQMYLDWITMVPARKVAESIPTRGMDDFVDLIVTELRDLLDPQNVPWEVECLTVYGDMAVKNGFQPGLETATETTGQNVLDRWVAFLKSLHIRFPYARHSEIVYGVQRIGTAVMRDLTMSQGKSFGSWWVTKCWIDEMIAFLAESGGFMKMKTTQTPESLQNPLVEQPTQNKQEPRYSSAGEDFEFSFSNPLQVPDRAPFPSTNKATPAEPAGLGGGMNPDDSGIGIRTPDEDFPMDKYTFSQSDLLGTPSIAT
ncbi:RFX DNA-binding domain-containing protein [Plectosphaerella plurivora]|uniref:RFX DNA-binding domain-containing protein n=1 Tax=Plectosphaerella plurivora TaxID=936078 RepID=A0A9P8VEX0_9PEZI|nr:RFX DNA-binding domain-containing protein [Plectosphaerella plurivora]